MGSFLEPDTNAQRLPYQGPYAGSRINFSTTFPENSREKWRKCISVTGSLCGKAQVQPIDKLDEACTNADDRMMLVQHHSGDRVMS